MDELFKIPPLLSPAVAGQMLEAMNSGKRSLLTTLDLGKSETEVALAAGHATFDSLSVQKKALKKIVKRANIAFAVDEDGPFPLEVRDTGYVKLVPPESGYGPPTFEISGIKMHRTKGIDPYEDARTKVAAAVRPNDVVLDTCGGFGYTALWARRTGASEVISIERNPDIIALRRYNPWSREYLEDDNIEKISGDAALEISEFDRGYFDAILHDPPRFTLAEELYSGEFISHMIEVLRSGGILCFYTGEPYRASKGTSFIDNLVKRIRKLGMVAGYNDEIQCIVAEKK